MQKSDIGIAKIPRRKGALSMRGRQLLVLAAIPIVYVIIFSYLPMVGIILAFKDFRADRGIFGSECDCVIIIQKSENQAIARV